MENLREALEALKKEDRASFHMPGHKYGGSGLKESFNSFWNIDITEIPGADNLHDPEGILLAAKERAAKAYGARESFLLVNGSSCGIMAMIMGTVKRGEKVVVSRDAHRSIHQAVTLGGLHPIYTMPKVDPETGLIIGMDIEALEQVLAEHDDIKAVVCTYPAYSGACVDLPQIRQLTAARGVQLLVDEAHGAHLWLSDALPPSALNYGADVVVQSLHKTMPALTQTAVLHIGSEKACRDQVAHYLTIFQSSSPSYVLLSSIDEAIGYGVKAGREAMAELLPRIAATKAVGRTLGFEFWDETTLPKSLIWHFDQTKLCLSGHNLGLDGYGLDEALRRHGVQSEYALYSHVLLMTSISNTEGDFHRLEEALTAISREMSGAEALSFESVQDGLLQLQAELVVLPSDAEACAKQWMPLEDSEGFLAGQWVIPYPPGVPILCPGERITGAHIKVLSAYLSQGHKVLGVTEKHIKVLI